jgi:putative phosphoribosyl transferase
MIELLPFRDRSEAGRLLGAELARRQLAKNAIVLALPRGGVPVGVEVAGALDAPLDIVVVRKLGVPRQPELAMGAIAGTTRVLNHELIRELGISEDEINSVVARESLEMKRRELLYRGALPTLVFRGRTVVLVDDGLATGSTMLAAVRHARSAQPQKVVVAIPVASAQACMRIRREADQCVCLAVPERFCAVGEWYINFHQVTDAEVQSMLRCSNSFVQSSP